MDKTGGFISRRNILIFLIFFIFLIEFFATLYLEYSSHTSTRIVGAYKIIFILALLFFCKIKRIQQKDLLLVLILSSLFLVNQFVLSPIPLNNIEYNMIYGSIYYVFRFIFIFIFIIIFKTIKNYTIIVSKVLKLIEYLLFFNAFIIIIGYISDLDLLASYPQSSRFGSDGIFNKVNETSYLYILYITSLYYKFVNEGKNRFKLVFIILISFLIGTKTIILFLVLLFVVHVFFKTTMNKYLKTAFGVAAVLVVFFLNKIAIFYFKLIPFWNNLLEQHSIVTLLLSKRDYLLKNNLEYVNVNWSFTNYFVGGPYYSPLFRITQMDGPDLLLFFGIIGAVIYLSLLYKCYFIKGNVLFNLIVILILICGLLSGGFFLSVMAMMYAFFLTVSVKDKSLIKSHHLKIKKC